MKAKIIAIACLLLGWAQLSAADTDGYLAAARNHMEKGNVRAAIIELKNALQQDPANLQARLTLGKIYLEQGKGASAEKELIRAKRLQADEESWTVPLGRSYLLQQKYREILDQIEAGPDLPAATQAAVWTLRGDAHLALRQPENAKDAYQQALEKDPKHQNAELGLIRIAVLSEDGDAGRQRLDALLERHPDNIQALVLRGELARRKSELKQALADFDRVLAADPDHTRALLSRAAILLQQRRYKAAEADLDRLEKNAPGAVVVKYLRAVLAFQQRDLDTAEDLVQQVLQVMPNHTQSQLINGAIKYTRGDFALADQYLSLVHAAIPGHLPTIKLMAAARMKLNQADRAVEVLEPAQKRYSEDAQLLAMLGNAYLQTGRYDEGSELLSRAIDISPELATLRTQLAFGLLAQGETDQAISELRSAVDLGQDVMQADILLVMSHLKNKQTEEALAASQALLGRKPDSPVAVNLVGLAHLAAGQKDEARIAFNRALEIDPKFVTAEINLARVALSEKDTNGAENHFKAALERVPGNLNATIGLALLADRRGDRKQMYDWLQQAQAANPGQSKPGLLLVQAHLKDQETLKALRVADELAGNFPDSLAVKRTLGMAQLASGETSSAVVSFQQLAAAQPSASNLLLLARAQLAGKDESAAKQSLQQALELSPGDLQVELALASLLMKEQDLDGAMKIAESVQQRHPKLNAGYELAGAVHGLRKEFDQSIAMYEKSYRLQPSSATANRLFRLSAAKGDLAGGLHWLEDWLRVTPDDAETRLTYATLLQSQGRKADAIAQYEKLLPVQQDNVVMLNNLAWLYFEQGNSKAIEYARRAYELMPKRPEIADTYGWIMVQQGFVEEGLRVLQGALLLAPDHAEIAYHVGWSLHRAGRDQEAQKLLNRIVRDHAKSPFAKQAQQLLDKIN